MTTPHATTQTVNVELSVMDVDLVVCRLEPGTPISDPGTGELWALTRTAGETSVVCRAEDAPRGATIEAGWMAMVVKGPLDFGLTGILSSIAQPLGQAGISLFAVSTYDTDYVLVKRDTEAATRQALTRAGHTLSDA